MKQEKNGLLVYTAATAVYLMLMIGAVLYGKYIEAQQQMIILVNIAMGAGFLGYLKTWLSVKTLPQMGGFWQRRFPPQLQQRQYSEHWGPALSRNPAKRKNL